MTVFLDIGAKRIQTYLARTPKLRGRRGASALLEHDLLHDWTQDAWRRHAQVNSTGKQVDGVLSLCFTDPDVEEVTVGDVAAETAALLRRLAPGAEWEIRIHRAASYREALRESAQAERAGQLLLPGGVAQYFAAFPAPHEVPVVRFCSTCGHDAAVCTGQVEPADASGRKENEALCADCSRRFLEGGHRTDERNWSDRQKHQRWQERIAPGGLVAERDLLTEVARARNLGSNTVRVADDFDDLARLGSGDANHLCTVSVDGNRFGDLFEALKDTEVSLRSLSEDLNAAIRHALVAATTGALGDGEACLPVVPHLVGGDDLFASVTADRAWDFVTTLLEHYHRRTASLAADYSQRAGKPVPAPTASVGLVFAHTAYPLASCLDLAEDALHRAKAQHLGREPAVCWVDVTEDGPELPRTRSAPRTTVLTAHRADIEELCGVSPSGRAALAEAAQGPDDPDTAVAALAYRLGTMPQVRPFLSASSPIPLLDALSLGRWWPCPRTT